MKTSDVNNHSDSLCPSFWNRGWYIKYQEGALHEMELRKREWTNSDLNFDNILNGMLALFTISTFEGWPKWVLSLKVHENTK